MDVQVVYNRSDTPHVVAADGRVAAGLSWTKIDIDTPEAGPLLKAGTLVAVDKPAGGDLAEDAKAAFDATYTPPAGDDQAETEGNDEVAHEVQPTASAAQTVPAPTATDSEETA